MKRLFILSLVILLCVCAAAQTPVKWSYSATKIGTGLFEVHLTATIDAGWHIYAQQQPEDAIAVPTSVKFTKNPVVVFEGAVKEIGRKQHFKDSELGIEAYQFSEKIDFVQQVKLKVKGKTSIRGSISFQACTDEKCLPPASTDFSIHLEQ